MLSQSAEKPIGHMAKWINAMTKGKIIYREIICFRHWRFALICSCNVRALNTTERNQNDGVQCVTAIKNLRHITNGEPKISDKKKERQKNKSWALTGTWKFHCVHHCLCTFGSAKSAPPHFMRCSICYSEGEKCTIVFRFSGECECVAAPTLICQ